LLDYCVRRGVLVVASCCRYYISVERPSMT
jgi:hypothetical protein